MLQNWLNAITGGFDSRTGVGMIWGIAMALGMWGYGEGIRRALKVTPIWTAGALGIAGFTAVTGWMDLTGLAFRTNLVLLLLPGIAGGLLALYSGKPKPQWWWIGPIATAACFAVVGSSWHQNGANWDDTSGYVPIVHTMQELGRSWDELSLRRGMGYAGHAPLQSLAMLFGLDRSMMLHEWGMGSWLAAATIIGILIGSGMKEWEKALLGAICVAIPHGTISTTPHITLCLMFLALWTLRSAPIAAALLGGCLLAFRVQTLPGIGMIGLWALWESRGNWKAGARWIGVAGAVGVIYMLPFWLNNWEQFKTPFWALTPGTINPAYLKFEGHLARLPGNIYEVLITNIGLIVGLGILGISGGGILPLIALAGYTISIVTMPEYSTMEWERYSWALLAAGGWAGAASLARVGKGKLAIVALLPLLAFPLKIYKVAWSNIKIENQVGPMFDWAEPARLQAKTPEGKTVATMILMANVLDFGRNRLVNLDEYPGITTNPLEAGNKKVWEEWRDRYKLDYLLTMNWEWAENKNAKPLAATWTSSRDKESDLRNYNRVWYPARKKMIETQEWAAREYETERSGPYMLINLRKEWSPEKRAELETKHEKEIAELETVEKEVKEKAKEFEAMMTRLKTEARKRSEENTKSFEEKNRAEK